MVLNLGICLEDFAVEVLAYIFKFCSIQDRLKIACVCKRFKDVIDSTGEIWRTFNTDDELTVHQFDLIIVKHASHLNHVSLRFSQKCVRYNSPDLYIESALAMCKHLTYLDLSYNTSTTILDFTLTMKFLKTLILLSCTSIDPINMIKCLKHCKTLNVLNISDCIQFNDEHVTLLVELFQDLPCLEVFNAESTCQFSVANARVLLERNKLKEFAVTPVWEPPTLWIDLIREYRHTKLGWCINVHCGRVNLPSYVYSDE